ncbi:MAG TPA: WYL domain-containing protein [Opitutaceae bacterium]|jgi:predicted DNA-binding transcriptional regulator YafY|nr:WYL domain-containing protein [Opitutaceae bacterium]
MPKSSNKFALARQWELLKKLPARGPGLTASKITAWLKDQGYSVTKRTVERDLDTLSASFGIVCNDESMPYGWHWMPGKQCDFTSIELTDAVSLVVAESILSKLLPATMLAALKPKFELARTKLAAMENHRYARWTEKVRYVAATINLIPPKVAGKVLAAVHEALLHDVQLKIRYLSPRSKKSKELTVHPLSLIQRGTTPYLAATAHDYPDVRLYAIHRIQRAEITKLKVVPPKGYTTDQYLAAGAMEFGGGTSIQLKAWVTDELAIYLAETPLSVKQTIQFKKGRHLLTAEVKDSWQLHWWILSQGAGFTVVSPAYLRNGIHTTLRTAAANYT